MNISNFSHTPCIPASPAPGAMDGRSVWRLTLIAAFQTGPRRAVVLRSVVDLVGGARRPFYGLWVTTFKQHGDVHARQDNE
jgi:hypothetical protein